MDFNLQEDPPELAAFRREVAAWMEENMRGGDHLRWSASWSTRENEEEYHFRRNLANKLGRKGWLFPMFPKQYGGAGMTMAHQVVLETELLKYGLSLSHVFYTLARIVAPVVLKWGTEEQKREFLPPMARGEISVWQVLTEPQGGSDVANCQTKAIRDGDDYVVTGQKVMVGHHVAPDFLWTLVCTNPQGKRHENLGWLHIPANLPGIEIQPMYLMMGIKNSVFFDGVRVPAKYLVGGENNGWKVANTHLELEHGGDGRIGVDPLVERVIEYCQKNEAGGKKLIEDERIRDTIADMMLELNTLRRFNQRNFYHRFARKPHPYGGVQQRYFQRMARLRNGERLQQIMGVDALVQDLSVHEVVDFEYAVRTGPGQLHGGGTLDTDRLVFARRVGLGRPVFEKAPETI
ncbi:MAG TPA: acyl-CoA dehydrogenase family protein [Verrucomicrobiae bacterium]|jgi:alkylation response protein AidB-like acyl-CoA dehydrogenase|nr:acyl-CoA dehydrogenase family protein [Verrucomicrobiae bacterium]